MNILRILSFQTSNYLNATHLVLSNVPCSLSFFLPPPPPRIVLGYDSICKGKTYTSKGMNHYASLKGTVNTSLKSNNQNRLSHVSFFFSYYNTCNKITDYLLCILFSNYIRKLYRLLVYTSLHCVVCRKLLIVSSFHLAYHLLMHRPFSSDDSGVSWI